MALAIFMLLSWALVSLFLLLPSKLKRRESVFLFLVLLDINISVFWITGLEMKKITLSEQVPEYLTYLLYRTLFVPLLPIMVTNWLSFCRFLLQKLLLWIGFGIAFALLEKWCVTLKVFSFNGWNVFDSLVIYYLYLLIAIYLLKWFRRTFAEEGIRP